MIRPFVLLSTQRSGSTWVIDMLNSHPAITAYSELLLENAHGKPEWGGAKDLGFWNDYYGTEHARCSDTPRRGLLYKYLDQVYAPRANCSAIGFKLMYGQFGAFPELFDYMKKREVKVVHLIRENLLDILLSKETASQRDIFHSRVEDQLGEVRINLDTRQLLQRLETQLGGMERARRIFEGSGLPYLEVMYEDLISDAAWFDQILDFLCVSTARASLSSSLKKLNKAPHRDLIENYESVETVLRGTRFEALLR